MTVFDKNFPYPLKQYQLTDKEIKLIELLRSMKFGECVVYIKNSQPIRVEKLKESIEL